MLLHRGALRSRRRGSATRARPVRDAPLLSPPDPDGPHDELNADEREAVHGEQDEERGYDYQEETTDDGNDDRDNDEERQQLRNPAADDDTPSSRSSRQLAISRRISKNCSTIKKFGDRLHMRRRQRHADRAVMEDVERMRETLLAMDRQLTLLDSITLTMRQNAQSAAMDTIKTYFRHMRHGLNPRDVAHDREITTPFLKAVMSPDLKCQDFSGLESFFQQWEYVTKYHAQITMTNDSLTALPAEDDARGKDVYVVKATGVTMCRISRDTLVHFFPHIIQDEPLVQWLIDKEYGYGYTMILHFNSEGRVFQFESRIDLTSGLLTLLNDPHVTLKLIDSSMWTRGGNLRGEVQEELVEIENGFLA